MREECGLDVVGQCLGKPLNLPIMVPPSSESDKAELDYVEKQTKFLIPEEAEANSATESMKHVGPVFLQAHHCSLIFPFL